jgi:hypothetical protein
MQFTPASCYFIPLNQSNLSSTLFSNACNLCSSLKLLKCRLFLTYRENDLSQGQCILYFVITVNLKGKQEYLKVLYEIQVACDTIHGQQRKLSIMGKCHTASPPSSLIMQQYADQLSHPSGGTGRYATTEYVNLQVMIRKVHTGYIFYDHVQIAGTKVR